MSFLLFNILFVVTIAFLLLLLSMVWPPDSPWAPWWRTNKKTAQAICKLANISKDDVIYDLGCGDGTVLITAAKEFGAQGVGIEIDPLRFLFASIKVKTYGLSKKITIIKKNFYREDVSKATVIFVYLVPKTLQKLKPKFLKELKPGTKIISFRYTMDLPLIRQVQHYDLYLYQIS